MDVVIRTGKALGKDVSEYEDLHARITGAYKKRFAGSLNTQTEKVLTLHINLADDPQALADALAEQIRACGMKLQTGLVGTPYLLHELSRYGHADTAWALLLRREYPGWLYSVSKGATTMWEHWDGIKPDGTFWDDDMNSYNHYAYGSVADWVFGVVITITYDMRVNGEPVFSGTSEHVFLDRDGKFVRMRRAMPKFCAAIEQRIGKQPEP